MRKICKECANYDHKNLKHTKACGNCVTAHYKDGTESDPSNWRALPQTNADRIRAMSDEELEKFINHFNICDMRTNDECKMSYCACCEVCVMDWLQQPAED